MTNRTDLQQRMEAAGRAEFDRWMGEFQEKRARRARRGRDYWWGDYLDDGVPRGYRAMTSGEALLQGSIQFAWWRVAEAEGLTNAEFRELTATWDVPLSWIYRETDGSPRSAEEMQRMEELLAMRGSPNADNT